MNIINKSCAILQPHYLPWIGYFSLIASVDEFVFLDDVKFIKREWKNRNKIRKTNESPETKWLTVPISKEYQDDLLINAQIDETHQWRLKHLDAIREVYKYSPFYKDYFKFISEIIADINLKNLCDLNITLIKKICLLLNITTKFSFSSSLNISDKREFKLRKICIETNSNTFIANNATENYVNSEFFSNYNIFFKTQNYCHPTYKQFNKNNKLEFIPHLSIIDLLFNYGEKSELILKEGINK